MIITDEQSKRYYQKHADDVNRRLPKGFKFKYHAYPQVGDLVFIPLFGIMEYTCEYSEQAVDIVEEIKDKDSE